MAQHDYVIDNSTGANVRADINSALQAIVTNNSGSSAPSATFPFMLFADSAAGTMKIRNAADNAFIELFQLDGTFTLEDGSASTPALAFRDDLNTGIFSSAADTFNVATGGVERMELGSQTVFNEDGADVDFRIEGDTDTNLFRLDASTDRIGIGVSTPQQKLHIGVSDSGSSNLVFTNATTGSTTNDGFIIGITGGEDAQLNMLETASIKFSTADTERMRIDGSGRLLVGTTITASTDTNLKLQVYAPSNGSMIIGQTNTSASGTATVNFAPSNSVTGAQIVCTAEEDFSTSANRTARLSFSTRQDGTIHERMRIGADGNVGIGLTDANHLFHVQGTSDITKFNCTSTGDVTAIVMRHARGNLSGFSGKMISFTGNANTEVGTIRIALNTTSYNTSSDYRLKENATAISDGITRLKTLKPYKFNWISDDTNTPVDGFFAHEVVSAVPEAVSGTKDAVATEDSKQFKKGDPIYQQIDQSKLVPLLVAAVQELIGKVEALEAA